MIISRKAGSVRIVILVSVVMVAAGLLFSLWERQRQTEVASGELAGLACMEVEPLARPGKKSLSISLQDHSKLLGKEPRTKTFSIAVTDLNSDSRDDIVVGAHGENPIVYINDGEAFIDRSEVLFPSPERIDRHGYTFADLDNDGDLDVAISGGGSDGVGKGSPNIFLRNNSSASGLKFAREQVSDDIALPRSRTRTLIPVVAPGGAAVDLYLAALSRSDYPNRLFRNHVTADEFSFSSDDDHPLTRELEDHGRGVFADFDNDGRRDYLTVNGRSVDLYWHPESGRETSTLASRAYSVKAADFNNDGKLDIFVGRSAGPSGSDIVSSDANGLIYVIRKHGDDDNNLISFKTSSDSVTVDFMQHVRATESFKLGGAEDIYIGANAYNPKRRKFTLSKDAAAGVPENTDFPGIYLWYEPESSRWYLKWRFYDFLDIYKGVLSAGGITGLETADFVRKEPREVDDYIAINQGNGIFKRICLDGLRHRESTVATTVADFNGDGWLDILGVRHGEQGAVNGRPFVLENHGGETFSMQELPLRDRDRLHRADIVAHGFFDDDDRPDAVITNGYGQIPGTYGVTQLLLNRGSAYEAMRILLRGTTANSYALGARLSLQDARGTVLGFRIVGLNTNISQDTFWQHFGLGDSVGPWELAVEWPDGKRTSHTLHDHGKHYIEQP